MPNKDDKKQINFLVIFILSGMWIFFILILNELKSLCYPLCGCAGCYAPPNSCIIIPILFLLNGITTIIIFYKRLYLK